MFEHTMITISPKFIIDPTPIHNTPFQPMNLAGQDLVGKYVFFCFITAEKGGVARAKGEGEKEKKCTTEGKSRRPRDEKAPWAL